MVPVGKMVRVMLGAVLLAAAPSALAERAEGRVSPGRESRSEERGSKSPHGSAHAPRPKAPRAVPEFDPAAAGAIATLLGGAGLLLARRRR